MEFIFRTTFPPEFRNSPPAKKARPRTKQKQVPKKKPAPKLPYVPTDSVDHWFGKPIFGILPAQAFPDPNVAFTLNFFTTDLKQQNEMLKSWKPPGPLRTEEYYLALRRALQKTKRVRFQLRKFLQLWRFKRLQQANEEDPVLLEVPKHPVYIIDWKLRRKYMFDPKTLSKDITERLLTHDGFFEDCQAPRNPFTNLPLTLSQNLSIWNQISLAPVATSAAFAEFRKARYDIQRYYTENLLSLQLHAFRSTMKNPYDIDTQERVLDFITYAYDQEALDPPDGLYAFIFKHYAQHAILQEWIRICREFYETGMIHFKNIAKVHQIQDTILNKSVPLIKRDRELMMIRRQHIRLTTRHQDMSH